MLSRQTVTPQFDEGHRDYTYRRLEKSQIRLLKLLRGHSGAELQASLEVINLPVVEKKPIMRHEYEALSYYWGEKAEQPFNYSINILEGSESFLMLIRPNLEKALRRLRRPDTDRYLWVDALCINQRTEDGSGSDEKNLQIPRMHEIYNKASRVCVWLGAQDDSSDNAMAFVNRMLDLNIFDRFEHNPAEAQSLADFATLLRRPWFSRRWIVQEIAVARRAQLYCGTKEVSWEKFSGAISLFSSKHIDLSAIFKASETFKNNPDYLGDVQELGAFQLVHAASNFFRKSDEGDILEHLQSLEDVVSQLTTFEASNSKDTIYAVLSLSNDATPREKSKSAFAYDPNMADSYFDQTYVSSNPTSPMEDVTQAGKEDELKRRVSHSDASDSHLRVKRIFGKGVKILLKPLTEKTITIRYTNKSVFEVYKDFLELAISNSNSLDILCRPWAAKDEELPSWIPKKTGATFGLRANRAYSRIRGDLFVGSARGGVKNYAASGENKARWDYRDDEVLTHSLVVKGFVLDSIKRKLVPAMGGVIPAEWQATWKALPKKPADSFWRTLVADRGPEGQKPPPPYYQLACDYAFEQRVNQGYLDTREMMKDNCPSIVKEFLGRVQSVTWMRRLIISNDMDFVGLVPYETKKRDIICVLEGCSVPVVLRKFDVSDLRTQQMNGTENPDIKVTAPSVGEQSPIQKPVIFENPPRQEDEITRLQKATRVVTTETRPRRASWAGIRGEGILQQLSSTSEAFNVNNFTPNIPSARKEQTTVLPTTAQSFESAHTPDSDPEQQTPGFPRRLSRDAKTESWRLKPRPKHYYALIGECYIHGMMDGEALKHSLDKKQEFWLR